MSDSEGASNSFEPLAGPMMDYWAAFTQQWAQAAKNPGGSSAQSAQREWCNSASESIDEYLRSPLFLQLLKQHIDTLIELQQRAKATSRCNDADLSQVVQQLERIEQRLTQIEKRLSETEEPL